MATAEDAMQTDAAADDEPDPRTDLALVVAALGGGPGDGRESPVRREVPPVVVTGWSKDDRPHDAAA